jgi:hypothetical protein
MEGETSGGVPLAGYKRCFSKAEAIILNPISFEPMQILFARQKPSYPLEC